MNTSNVDSYLRDGCGRCDKYQTPECKVHLWTEPLLALRDILLQTELQETMKWGSPCYTVDAGNVLMLTSLTDACALNFFQGAALDDPDGLLEAPGPNSRYARYLKFHSLDEVETHRDAARNLIEQAIAFKKSGKKVPVSDQAEPMPEELEERLESDPDLKEAFEDLTPGRQRSYILYVGGAKQSATRERRVDRAVPKIYDGKGWNER